VSPPARIRLRSLTNPPQFGPAARHFCSILQFIQLILNCGLICLSNGQGLSQIAKGNLCFSVCIVIWAVVGMVLGQIRGLANFSILANSSVWRESFQVESTSADARRRKTD
jgi:hypothetical protein